MLAVVVRFPGSNCDLDCLWVLEQVLKVPALLLPASSPALPPETSLVILPGGFSYGDYLRSGAIAKTAPIMPALRAYTETGGLLLGICNGFQILCEAGLLPGTLLANTSGNFLCKEIELVLQNNQNPFAKHYKPKQKLKMPIAHAEGNYQIDSNRMAQMEAQGQIIFRYSEDQNGSASQIAGISNERGNILGLMPHPERACESILGSTDGLALFRAALSL